MFKDRTSDTVTLDVFGKHKIFRLLQKVEFSSERKKMSVVIEDPATGLILLYSKGADLAIFDKLSVKFE
jgi:magnesium-transporting ATPase (P-type)